MKPATVSKEYNLGNIVLMNIKYIPHMVFSFRVLVSNRHGYPECKRMPPTPLLGIKMKTKDLKDLPVSPSYTWVMKWATLNTPEGAKGNLCTLGPHCAAQAPIRSLYNSHRGRQQHLLKESFACSETISWPFCLTNQLAALSPPPTSGLSFVYQMRQLTQNELSWFPLKAVIWVS